MFNSRATSKAHSHDMTANRINTNGPDAILKLTAHAPVNVTNNSGE